MNPDQLRSALDETLRDRRLLDHPFYRRWNAGELQLEELAAYAEQYAHFERVLPAMLRSLEGALGEDPAAELVRQNRIDEETAPEPHVQLFGRFAAAVGANPDAPATPATTQLVDTYKELVELDPVAGLGGFVAYETQAASIAASKAEGLRRRYGVGAAATEFWDVHATMDVTHADWTIEALARLASDADDVAAPARRAADAWWAFLDEREAAAPRH